MLEIYDSLMNVFEPDLVSDMIPELEYIYKDETKEERQKRLDGYVESFQMFFDAFQDMVKGWEGHFMDIKKSIVKEYATEVGLKEEDLLTKIKQDIDDSSQST